MEFKKGDKVLATWRDKKKYPATIIAINNNGSAKIKYLQDGIKETTKLELLSIIPPSTTKENEIRTKHINATTLPRKDNPFSTRSKNATDAAPKKVPKNKQSKRSLRNSSKSKSNLSVPLSNCNNLEITGEACKTTNCSTESMQCQPIMETTEMPEDTKNKQQILSNAAIIQEIIKNNTNNINLEVGMEPLAILEIQSSDLPETITKEYGHEHPTTNEKDIVEPWISENCQKETPVPIVHGGANLTIANLEIFNNSTLHCASFEECHTVNVIENVTTTNSCIHPMDNSINVNGFHGTDVNLEDATPEMPINAPEVNEKMLSMDPSNQFTHPMTEVLETNAYPQKTHQPENITTYVILGDGEVLENPLNATEVCKKNLNTSAWDSFTSLLPEFQATHTFIHHTQQSNEVKSINTSTNESDQEIQSNEDSDVSMYEPSHCSSENLSDSDQLPNASEIETCTLEDTTEESSKIKVFSTNNSGSRKYDKKYACLYCEKLVSKLARHLESQHKNENDVAVILAESNYRKRRPMWNVLRNKGNHLHNSEVLSKGEGTLIVVHRPKSNTSATSFVPCPHCYGYYSKPELWRHRCTAKTFEKKQFQRNQWVSSGQMLLPTPTNVPDNLKEVLCHMKMDDVTLLIKNDRTILELGRKLVVRHGDDKDKHGYIKNKLREIARLVLELRKQKKFEKMSLEELLYPENFKCIIKAVKDLAGFNEASTKFQTPSLALKVGISLKKCASICKAHCIQRGTTDELARYEAFYKLMEMEYTDEVSSNALKTLHHRKQNKPKMLPLTEDVRVLQKFLKSKADEAKNILMKSGIQHSKVAAQAYSLLNEVILARIILFNRRRSGEVAKMKVIDYTNKHEASTRSDLEKSLPPIEQHLCKILTRVEIIGKRGQIVPVLLTNDISESLNILLQYRNGIQIPEENPFLFARLRCGSLGHIRGSDCLRKFAKESNAKEPTFLTSTRLRKHVATFSQILNLKDNELDMLAKFMGHDIRVHREFYRLPDDTVQLAKVSKIFLAMENGTLKNQQGKSLDDIDVSIDNNTEIEIDDDAETASVNGDSELSDDSDSDDEWEKQFEGKTKSPKNPKKKQIKTKAVLKSKDNCARRQWSEEEKSAVKRHLKKFIIMGKLPGKKVIEECINNESGILMNRTWRNVKDCCRNMISTQNRQLNKN